MLNESRAYGRLLGFNSITSIAPTAFSASTALHTLLLQHNLLTSLPLGFGASLASLTTLYGNACLYLHALSLSLSLNLPSPPRSFFNFLCVRFF